MEEKILSVTESYENGMEGYIIETSNRVIKLLIDNSQYCCESWGYVSSDDDFSEYIGATLRNVTTVCSDNGKMRLKRSLGKYANDYLYNAEFITLDTNNGELVFAVYNTHNGYYGHSILIQIGDNIEKSSL